MKRNDIQLATPERVYSNTKANITALTGLSEGAVAYSTDTDEFGVYNGSAWTWSNVTDGGWIPCTETWTRTGNHTFTISGNVTVKYRKGTKVRYKDGGSYEYGVIGVTTYSSPNTTITLISNTDYAMAAATITDTYISYIVNPESFPTSFNFTPTVTSGSGAITAYTVNSYKWIPTAPGKLDVFFVITITTVGTANGDGRVTMPIAASSAGAGTGRENAITGSQLQVQVSSTVNVLTYANGTPFAGNGCQWIVWVTWDY